MDQPAQPPNTPQTGNPPGDRPAPQVLHIAAKPGGFARAVGLVIGLMVMGFVFFFGLMIGILLMLASGSVDDIILRKGYRDGGRDALAIIPVSGAIDASSSRFVRACVDHVLDDPSIKGVVLRVDSPGGGVTASDQIWYEVNRLKKAGLPVVASYGSVAASGGYYVSCATDHIVAEETCTTGSIGVISQAFVVEEMMNTVGVEVKTLVATDSPDKDLGNPFRKWTDEDRATIVAMLDAAYEIFTTRVRDGRAGVITDPERLAAIADGSVYTAAEALDLGLIDQIGYLDDAIVDAERRAGIRGGAADVFWLTEPMPLFGPGLFVSARRPAAADAIDAERIREVVTELTTPRVMYLMQ